MTLNPPAGVAVVLADVPELATDDFDSMLIMISSPPAKPLP
jgi:hypothetical protein